MALKIHDNSGDTPIDKNVSLDNDIAKVDSYMAVERMKKPENSVPPVDEASTEVSEPKKTAVQAIEPVPDEEVEIDPIEELMGPETAVENIDISGFPQDSAHDEEKSFVVGKPKKQITRKFVIVILLALTLIVGGIIVAWFLGHDRGEPTQNTTTQKPDVNSVKLGEMTPTVIEGVVEYSKDGKKWQALSTTTKLQQGSQVRTGPEGRAALTVDKDGSIVRLDNESAVKLSKISALDIQIENLYGNVYSRVQPSKTRSYAVLAGDEVFTAKGTAFRVMNAADRKGVEVYESKVSIDDVEVNEGQAYYVKNQIKSQARILVAVDVAAAKKDTFVAWNIEQDKMTPYVSKLGVLSDPEETSAEPVAPLPETAIRLGGAVSNYAMNLSWQVENAASSKGFKVVYSSKTATPVYGVNSSQYISNPAARKATVTPPEGRSYYVRICLYDGSSCGTYSNAIKLTVPAKPVPEGEGGVAAGATKLSINGSVLSWTISGTAPNGYKVVASTAKTAPEYPADGYIKYEPNEATKSFDVGTKLDAGTWSIRVCKYTGSGCTDYSNTVTYVKS